MWKRGWKWPRFCSSLKNSLFAHFWVLVCGGIRESGHSYQLTDASYWCWLDTFPGGAFSQFISLDPQSWNFVSIPTCALRFGCEFLSASSLYISLGSVLLVINQPLQKISYCCPWEKIRTVWMGYVILCPSTEGFVLSLLKGTSRIAFMMGTFNWAVIPDMQKLCCPSKGCAANRAWTLEKAFGKGCIWSDELFLAPCSLFGVCIETSSLTNWVF